jgi:hypothetical protein
MQTMRWIQAGVVILLSQIGGAFVVADDAIDLAKAAIMDLVLMQSSIQKKHLIVIRSYQNQTGGDEDNPLICNMHISHGFREPLGSPNVKGTDFSGILIDQGATTTDDRSPVCETRSNRT